MLSQFLAKSGAARGTSINMNMFENQQKSREERAKVLRARQSFVAASSSWCRANTGNILLRLAKKTDLVSHNPEPEHSAPKVSCIPHGDMEAATDQIHVKIAQEVSHMVRHARQQSADASQTCDEIDQASLSDSDSSDERDSVTSSTGSSRKCDSVMEDDRAADLATYDTAPASKEEKRYAQQSAARQAICSLMAVRLEYQEQHCDALQTKRGWLVSRRLADKEKLDEYAAGWQQAEDCCGKLVKKVEALQDRAIEIEAEREAHLRAKEERIVDLLDNQQCAIAVIQSDHDKEIAAKDAELHAAKAAVIAKGAELMETRRKGAEDIRTITKASESNRKAKKAELEAAELKIQQMDTGFKDKFQAQRDEIERLTRDNRRLHKQVHLVSAALTGGHPDVEGLRGLIAEVDVMEYEVSSLRKNNTILKEKIENTLEAMQQDRDHWKIAHDAETQAQMEVYDLRNLVSELQEKLARRDQTFRDFQQHGEVFALATAMFENNVLRTQIKEAGEENATLRKENNKVDAESLQVAMDQEVSEVKYYQQQSELEILRNFRDTAGQELDLLRGFKSHWGDMSEPLQADIQKYLQNTTEKNQALTAKVVALTKELTKCEKSVEVVKDEVHTELIKAQKITDYWCTAFYDEAVPKVENLYKEISALNAELGQDIKVEEQLVRNVRVDNRAWMRYAAEGQTIKGIDTKEIPAEYNEPGFVPGWLPATMDALRFLRPLGWAPVYHADKCYLQPMYRPFTEEDAMARLEAQEQKEEAERQMEMVQPAQKPRTRTMLMPSAVMAKRAPPRPIAKPSIPKGATVQQKLAPAPAPRLSRQLEQATAIEAAPQAPPYESRFDGVNSMTKDMWEELDTDNRLDFIKYFIEK